jgi:hypothetical protein
MQPNKTTTQNFTTPIPTPASNVTPTTPTPTTSTSTITSGAMAPVKPVILPPTAPVSNASATQDYIGTTSAAIQDSQAKQAQAQALLDAQNTKNNAGSAAQTALNSLLGIQQQIGNAGNTIDYTAQNQAKQQLDQYTAQIAAEQLANRRAIENLQQNNPNGTFGGALQDNINNINRASVSKQADLAILQAAANNQYDTASAIADRQLKLKLEPLQAQLDNAKFFYEQNKADFNKADERLYADMVKKADSDVKKAETIGKTIADLKTAVAQSDAPNKAELLNQMSSIDLKDPKALDTALKISGKYGGDYYKTELLKQQIETEKAQRANYNANAAKTRAETLQLGEPGAGKPPTDVQVQNAGYADRVSQANSIIDSKSDTFAKMGYIDFKAAASNSPLANAYLTDDQRQVAQAMRNFITAKLRKESGAAISQSEFDDARAQYFPAYGDDPQTLKQKKNLRDSVFNNLVQGSGSAYKLTPVDKYFNSVTGSIETVNNKVNNKEASFISTLK